MPRHAQLRGMGRPFTCPPTFKRGEGSGEGSVFSRAALDFCLQSAGQAGPSPGPPSLPHLLAPQPRSRPAGRFSPKHDPLIGMRGADARARCVGVLRKTRRALRCPRALPCPAPAHPPRERGDRGESRACLASRPATMVLLGGAQCAAKLSALLESFVVYSNYAPRGAGPSRGQRRASNRARRRRGGESRNGGGSALRVSLRSPAIVLRDTHLCRRIPHSGQLPGPARGLLPKRGVRVAGQLCCGDQGERAGERAGEVGGALFLASAPQARCSGTE